MQRRNVFGFQIFIYCCYLVFGITDGAQVCDAIDQCTCKTQDGKYVSLWEVDQRLTVGDAGGRGFSYNFRPCTSFSISTPCQNVLGCQVTGSGASDSFAIAYKPKLITTSYDSQKQLLFTYNGKERRKTIITLVCDITATKPKLEDVYEFPQFRYTTKLTTRCACPGACNYTPPHTKPPHTQPHPTKAPRPSSSPASSSAKLSIGSIICIVLLVLAIVYLVVGIVVSKFALHKEGSEIIPNKSFWKDLPFLVKDGAVFTFRKVTRSKGEYEQI